MGRRSRKLRRTDDAQAQRGGAGKSPERMGESEPEVRDRGSSSRPGGGQTRRFRGWRGWLLRLSFFVLSPLLFFGLLEAALRLVGYGYPTGFFLGPDAAGKCTTNHRFGWRFFPPALARDPQPCVLLPKPSGTVRIFVLGSSAAMGSPDPSFSFGEVLAVMLREQYPDTRFEVVNGAMVAINSHAALEIARDCAGREPDLFVVYMGNNEVIGPFGPGTVFQHWSPSLTMIRASLAVKSARVVQLLDDVVGAFRRSKDAPRHWRGMDMFLDAPVTADDPRLSAVYDNFRQNLNDICRIARRAQIPVVLATVAVNLRDFPPLASQHRHGLPPAELAKWEATYRAGGEAEAGNRWLEALDQYAAAAQIDDRFAELSFRIGQCLLKAGRGAEARGRFELARDLDALRFRADSHINAVIRQVAGEQEAAGVRLADAERKLAEASPDAQGIPGADFFYEHVHLNFDGNYALARTVLDQVREAVPKLAEGRRREAVPSRQRCAELLALTAWDEYRSAADVVEMTARRPFTNQWNHQLRQTAAQQKRDHLRNQAETPAALAAAEKTYAAALAKSPDDWRLHYRFGMLAMQMGRPGVAAEHLQIVSGLFPRLEHPIENALGIILAGRGQVAEAIAHYQKALEIQPDYVEAHINAGNLLAGIGQFDAAVAHFQTVLAIDPNFADVEYNLGDVLAKRGLLDEATGHLKRALELNPGLADAEHVLGYVLLRRGRLDEALGHLRKALELKPEFADAEYVLGYALGKRGQFAEAIVHLQKALEIRPDDANFRQSLEAMRAEQAAREKVR